MCMQSVLVIAKFKTRQYYVRRQVHQIFLLYGILYMHTLIWQSSTPSVSSAKILLTVSINMYPLRHIQVPSVGEKRRLAPMHTQDVLLLFDP